MSVAYYETTMIEDLELSSVRPYHEYMTAHSLSYSAALT